MHIKWIDHPASILKKNHFPLSFPIGRERNFSNSRLIRRRRLRYSFFVFSKFINLQGLLTGEQGNGNFTTKRRKRMPEEKEREKVAN